MITTTTTFHSDNPNTIWNRLARELGREPTNAEAEASVKKILADARTQQTSSKKARR